MVFSFPFDHALTVAEETGMPLSRVAAEIREMGFNATDIDLALMGSEQKDTVMSICTLLGLRIRAVHAVMDFVEKTAVDYAGAIRLAAKSGARYLVVMPGILRNGILAETAIAHMKAEMKNFASMAAEYDMKVLFTNLNHVATPYSTPSEIRAFLEGTGNVGLQFDSGNMYMQNENTVVVFRDLMPSVRRLTLDDILVDDITFSDIPVRRFGEKSYYSAPVGQGDVPMKTMVRSLRDFGYAGDVLVTVYHAKDILTSLRESMEFIRENQ